MQADSTEALGAQIAQLYKELSYPSEAKFRAALAKRNIQVPKEFARQLASEQGSRQLYAPPPRFTGKVTAQSVDDRWAADLIDFQSKTREKSKPLYVLLVQDLFSRFLFAFALRSKTEVESAFLRLLRKTKRKPTELNTDAGSEFTNAAFQSLLQREGIYHVIKEAPQDLATLDRAIGELRAVLSRRLTDGGTWYDELQPAIRSMNATEHTALFGRDPDDVLKDDDLQFDLAYHNAEMRQVNADLSNERGEKLEQQGAFRVYLPTTTGFKRRAGRQNWSEEVHQVQSTQNGRVTDTKGESFRMSMVKAVPRATTVVKAPDFAAGGSRKVEDRRRQALETWLPTLLQSIARAGPKGLNVQQASKDLAKAPGFQQALRNQRATVLQFAQLWPQHVSIEKRGTQRILRAKQVQTLKPQEPDAAPQPRAAPQEPDAAPQIARPREPHLRLRRAASMTLDSWRA